MLILSGSKGFGSPAYDEIAQALFKAGLSPYLVHVLAEKDLNTIATAANAKARIAYYAMRMPAWRESVQQVAKSLRDREEHGDKLGVLGISLGAQIVSAATIELSGVQALVLVSGGFPNNHERPATRMPPLLLMWGRDDKVFPLSTGKQLQQTAQKFGGSADMETYEGEHDFFLRSNATNAYKNAANFLAKRLLPNN